MKSRCGRRRWLIAYVAGLFLTSAAAFPCWNAFLRDSLGRFITAEQLHVIEYAGLGGVAAWYLQATVRPWRTLIGLVGLVGIVGLLDERLQALLPNRFFEWSDVVLNWVGSLLGLLLFGTLALGLHVVHAGITRHAQGSAR